MPNPISNVGLFGTSGALPSGPGPADLTPLYYAPADYSARNMAITGVGMPGTDVPWMDPSSANLTEGYNPSAVGPAGYTPSSIMQAYMDFYANNPSAAGATAPPLGGGSNYPVPGAGAPPASAQQSVLSRIFGSTPAGALINILRGRTDQIPAVRLAQSIGHLVNPPQSMRQNALSPGQQLSAPTGGVAGGAGDQLDQAGRFAENSGTGNFVADQTTKYWEAAGGYQGNPNRMPVGDAGRSTGYMARSAGAFQPPVTGPGVNTSPAGVAAYNAWLMQQPGYLAWMQAHSGAPMSGGGGPADLGAPALTISGPPTGGINAGPAGALLGPLMGAQLGPIT